MANDDVSPALLDEITKKLDSAVLNDKKMQSILAKASKGNATHLDLEKYSELLGEHTSDALSRTLTADALPDETLYYHIAKDTVTPTLKSNLKRVNELGGTIQDSLNQKAGIGLKSVKPRMNNNRAEGLIGVMTKDKDLIESQKWLKEPIVNITQSFADSFIRENAEFQYKSGLAPVVSRDASVGCCEWCTNLEGTYEYPLKNNDIYRRHENCRCSVTFNPRKGTGKIQNVWSKQWASTDEAEKREERKNHNL